MPFVLECGKCGAVQTGDFVFLERFVNRTENRVNGTPEMKCKNCDATLTFEKPQITVARFGQG